MANYTSGKKTKEKIELTARYLFFTNGFENTTYTQIAEAANVNVGSIAYHFKSLESLADSIYTTILKQRAEVIKDKMQDYFPERGFTESAFALAQYRINTQAYLDYPGYARFVSGRLYNSKMWEKQAVNSTIIMLCNDYNAKITRTDLELEKYLYIPFSTFAAKAVNGGAIEYTAKELCEYQMTQRLKSLKVADKDIEKLLWEIDKISSKIRLNIDCYMNIT